MNKLVRLCLGSALLVTSSIAAETSNPLVGGQKAIFEIVSGSLIRGAEKMPEADYGFKPTPEVRSFGQLVGHAADAQMMFCSAVNGDKRSTTRVESTKTSKADLVQALKDATSYCEKVYSGMTDAEAPKMIKFFGQDSAKLTVLSFNNAHSDEHYGNMVTYLRLKNIVPPTSERKN
jgi:uncharacterized damage-inducible protein DinB